MSEEIKITIVIDNGKLNNGVDNLKENFVTVTHDSSMTIMSTLLKNKLISGSFCGARGDCGRCKIQFMQGTPTPTALERSAIEPYELRQGYRLACIAKPKADCAIRLALVDALEIDIISNMIDVTDGADQYSQRESQTKKHKPDVTESGIDAVQAINIPTRSGDSVTDVTNNKIAGVMISADLGTTTIAMQLMEMNTGLIIDTYCEMNPQRSYGADVLSRIQASCDGNREVLQKLVLEVLERGVARFRNQNAVIQCMCIAGNTTMEHLLVGYDVSSLGQSPFTPVEIGLQEYRHPAWDFTVWLTPGISAFVGGDIVAGLYACGLLEEKLKEKSTWQCEGQRKQEQEDFLEDKSLLFIDLGTNGEMAVTDGTRMIVTATAAGPAFEGGAGAGIIGSDMVACTAELLQQGIMDETGLLRDPFFTEGVSVKIVDSIKDVSNEVRSEREHVNYTFKAGRRESSFYITQADIRALQMAKAAVRAGVEVLLKRLEEQRADEIRGNETPPGGRQVKRVYLAGGFGYYLDVEAAFRIGLLPEHLRGCVQAVGNTSLEGAYRIGRDLWQHKIDKQTLEQSLASIESINLAKEKEFEELYVRHMNFSPYVQ